MLYKYDSEIYVNSQFLSQNNNNNNSAHQLSSLLHRHFILIAPQLASNASEAAGKQPMILELSGWILALPWINQTFNTASG